MSEKTTQKSAFGDGGIVWGASMAKGPRPAMEDYYLCDSIVAVEDKDNESTIGIPRHHILCIMDGHAGKHTAEFAQQHFKEVLCQQDAFVTYAKQVAASDCEDHLAKPSNQADTSKPLDLLKRALEDCFVNLDAMTLKHLLSTDTCRKNQNQYPANDLDRYLNNGYYKSIAGSTATFVIVSPDLIVCANAGDSRAIMSSDGELIPLSMDHKPDIPAERQRIEDAGGGVYDRKLNGTLTMSRAFGDFDLNDYPKGYHDENFDLESRRCIAQKLLVSPFPSIISRQRDHVKDEFLVIASDGVWDVLKNEECLSLVKDWSKESTDPSVVAERIIDECLFRQTLDNTAVIIANFSSDASAVFKYKQLLSRWLALRF